MKKIKLLIILLIPLLLLTGCGSDNGLNGAIKKTSIKEKGLESYRCKVDIINDKERIDYIVLNKENKEYDISISTEDGNYSFTINKDTKEKRHAPIDKPLPSEDIKQKYDYPNTDIFLSGLDNAKDVKKSKVTIGDTKYTKQSFKISKNDLNKILEGFDIKVKKEGTGFAYIDKDNYVYMINYESGKVKVTVTYTRYNDVK